MLSHVRLIVILCLLSLTPPAFAQLITSFETEADVGVISPGAVKVERVAEHATDGDWSLRVDFPGSPEDTWPGISWNPEKDTTGHQAVEFDVFNPAEEPVYLSWRIDIEGRDDAIFGGRSIQPGKPQTVDIWLVGMGRVKRIFPYIRMPRQDHTLYFDNFRWVSLKGDYFSPIHYVDSAPPPEPTEAETGQGFITFRRALTDVVFANSMPRGHERASAVEIFATPGECEPATLSLYALDDLSGVRVTFEGLPATGEVLPVRCLDKRVVYSSKEFIVGMPVLCERRAEVDVAAGTSQRFVIDLRVSDDADPAIHEGAVHIDRAGGSRVTLPLRLRVLPFRLIEPEGMFWGEYYTGPRLAADEEAWSEILRRDMIDMRDHGMTSVGLCFGPSTENVAFNDDGTCALNFDGTSHYEQFMALYVELGYPAPVILLSDTGQGAASKDDVAYESDEWAARYKAFWAAMQAEHQRRGWPEVIVQPVDEPGWQSRDHKDRNVRCLKLLKEIPGMRTEQDGPGDAYFHDEAGPFADVWNYNGSLSEPGTLGKALHGGRIVLIYNCDVESYRPEVDRYTAGWFQVAQRTHGCFNWAYMSWYGSPYDDQDHKTGTWMHVYPPMDDEPGGPSTGWIGAREGVDDYKYWYTLSRIVGRAKGAAGRASLDVASRIVDTLELSRSVRGRAQWTETGGRADGSKTIGGTLKLPNGWTHADYEKNRWRVAQATLDVLAALGEIERPAPPPIAKARPVEFVSDVRWARRRPAPVTTPSFSANRQVTIPVWDRAPLIDGDLDDEIWQTAAKLDAFSRASGRGKPKMPTDVLIGCDGHNLCLAATCREDNMDHITATVTEDGGQVWQDDCIEVFVDSNLDRSSFVQIMVNSLGTQGWNDSKDDKWRAKSEAAAKQRDESWTVELAIPMADLGLTGEQFGLNVCRERRPMETLELSCWSPTGGAFAVPARFGLASLGQAWIGALRVPQAMVGENEFTVVVKNEADAARSVRVELDVDGRREAVEPEPLELQPGAAVKRTYEYEVQKSPAPQMTLRLTDAETGAALAQRSFKPEFLSPLQVDVEPKLYYLSDETGFLAAELNLSRRLLRKSELSLELIRRGHKKRLRSATIARPEGNRLSARLNLSGVPEGTYLLRARLTVDGKRLAESEAWIDRLRGPFD